MAVWNDLLADLESQRDDQAKTEWLSRKQRETILAISKVRGGTNVVFYASAFLQKPGVPAFNLQLTFEEINGFMSSLHGMNCTKGLTLLLHTPGGITNAAETIAAYLHSKFDRIEVVVPTYAMSAGTMLCLAADKIVMGRQSQLGPIDPQMPIGNRTVSACAIVDQFAQAKREIIGDPEHGIDGDLRMAHVWAPILQHLGPALLQEANNALDYAEDMVAGWLSKRMFKGLENREDLARSVASYFRAPTHKSHGRRIDREEARRQGVSQIEDLESDQAFQDAVLTAYHVMTITLEKTLATKVLLGHNRMWVKNFGQIARSSGGGAASH